MDPPHNANTEGPRSKAPTDLRRRRRTDLEDTPTPAVGVAVPPVMEEMVAVVAAAMVVQGVRVGK